MDFEDLWGQLLPMIIVILIGLGTILKRVIESIVKQKSPDGEPKGKGRKAPSLFEEIRKQIEMIEGAPPSEREPSPWLKAVPPEPHPVTKKIPAPIQSPERASPSLRVKELGEAGEEEMPSQFNGISSLEKKLKSLSPLMPSTGLQFLEAAPAGGDEPKRRGEALSQLIKGALSYRGLRRAMVFKEVLGTPLGLREKTSYSFFDEF